VLPHLRDLLRETAVVDERQLVIDAAFVGEADVVPWDVVLCAYGPRRCHPQRDAGVRELLGIVLDVEWALAPDANPDAILVDPALG